MCSIQFIAMYASSIRKEKKRKEKNRKEKPVAGIVMLMI